MFCKTDEIERFLDCAFGSARNDRMRNWNGDEYCAIQNLASVTIPIFMRELICIIRVIRSSFLFLCVYSCSFVVND
jgi:hypothetical protein